MKLHVGWCESLVSIKDVESRLSKKRKTDDDSKLSTDYIQEEESKMKKELLETINELVVSVSYLLLLYTHFVYISSKL